MFRLRVNMFRVQVGANFQLPTCRFCGIAPESSTHIALCIATEPIFIFEFIEGLLGIDLKPPRGPEGSGASGGRRGAWRLEGSEEPSY